MVPDEVNVYLWQERLPSASSRCAERITGALSASCRRPCATSDDLTFDDVIPSLRSEAGAGLSLQGLHLVLHLPHPSPQRRALPRPPLLPAGRRGAHPQPGRRAGHEHRPAGRLQPGVEAGAGRARRARTRRCSTPTSRSASRSRERLLNTHRPRVPARRVRQLARRTAAHENPRQDRRLCR